MSYVARAREGRTAPNLIFPAAEALASRNGPGNPAPAATPCPERPSTHQSRCHWTMGMCDRSHCISRRDSNANVAHHAGPIGDCNSHNVHTPIASSQFLRYGYKIRRLVPEIPTIHRTTSTHNRLFFTSLREFTEQQETDRQYTG